MADILKSRETSMKFREKFVVVILTVSLLLAWASVAHAGMEGAIVPAGNNLGVNPDVCWSEPGDPLSHSGLALPYGTYTTRDLGQGPYPNQSCKSPGFNWSVGAH
jgi:hypothetical protein